MRMSGGRCPCSLIKRAAVKPSILGIITSSSTTSGRSLTALARPSSPSRAVNTSKPAFLSLISTRRSTSGSSSTASTRIDMLCLLLAHERPNLVEQGIQLEWLGNEVHGAQRQHARARAEPESVAAGDRDHGNRGGGR